MNHSIILRFFLILSFFIKVVMTESFISRNFHLAAVPVCVCKKKNGAGGGGGGVEPTNVVIPTKYSLHFFKVSSVKYYNISGDFHTYG